MSYVMIEKIGLGTCISFLFFCLQLLLVSEPWQQD